MLFRSFPSHDTAAGVKNQLKKIQKAISEDIKEYGKTNPEWYDAFKEADKLYGDVAKRERLENILRHKATNEATESLSYNVLAKAINNHKNTASIRKQLTPDVFKKIQKLGIDLPAAAVTDSKLTALADQYVGKAPIFGNKLKNKYLLAEEQTQKVLSDIFDEIGPARTPEIEGQIAGLYNKVATSLPTEAKVLPVNLKKAIDDIKINTAILSPDEKSLLQSLETIKNEIEPASKIISQYGPIKLPLQEYDVNKLVGTKKSLNSIIKWDTDAGVKNQLKKIQKAISQDIKEYGKSNPEWYDAFKEADKLYGDVARREKLENILGHKAANYTTNSLSYNALAKAINDPKNSESIKKQLTPEVFKKIQKLGTVAKAMAIKSKNIPNPTGTATTGGISAAIFGLFYDPITTTKLLGGGYGATKLLTDKKFLDLALKLAENPNNLATTTALNHRITELTGYPAIALSKNLQEMNNTAE